jgi:threonyl-tRNA synthetase
MHDHDHKKLGPQLDLFAFDDDIGRGLPLWLPHGMAIREELEKLMKELEFADGYQRVATPHLARESLFVKTGHLPHYEDGMFPRMSAGEGDEAEAFRLRPMNCPFHHKIFAARPRSYRELPLRLAEYGQVYRYEGSGAVSGLLRVRGMCMNDAHLYCAREQVVDECKAVIAMHRRVYALLGLKSWRVRFSTRGPAPSDKFLDDPRGWAESEALLREVLEACELPFFEGPGEAAFYGPKIDFQFQLASGREETASTLQLDFGIAERLDLSYVGPDGERHRPYILHRAPLGTHERFVALLLEHSAGAFPTWLAPVQVKLVPVGEKFVPDARAFERQLRGHGVRVEVDDSGERFNKKLRLALTKKVPNVVVLGQREHDEGSVTLRKYGEQHARSLSREAFVAKLLEAIRDRAPGGVHLQP